MDIQCNMSVNLNLVRRIYRKKLDNGLFEILLEFDENNFTIINDLSAEEYKQTDSYISRQLSLNNISLPTEKLETTFDLAKKLINQRSCDAN